MVLVRSTHALAFTLRETVVVLGLLVVLIAFFIPAPQTRGFLMCTYTDTSGKESTYRLFVPHRYRSERAYPLLVFLHGAGDQYRLTDVGLGPAIRKREKEFSFFVLFPRLWDRDPEGRQLIELLKEVERNYRIDTKRVYLTGLSDGGAGTWLLAAAYPERWAAVVPVAGGASPSFVPYVKHIPCWCFHGAADQNIPVKETRETIKALKAAGAKVRYTELADYGHNVWDEAYGSAKLYEWLLEQKLP